MANCCKEHMRAYHAVLSTNPDRSTARIVGPCEADGWFPMLTCICFPLFSFFQKLFPSPVFLSLSLSSPFNWATRYTIKIIFF